MGQGKMPKDAGARRPRAICIKTVTSVGARAQESPTEEIELARMRMVKEKEVHPEDLIYSDLNTDDHSDDHSDDHLARLISMQDRGSRPKYARVAIQNAPCLGIIDTGSDITIIGGYLFKKLATVSRLQKKDFKQPDKTPLAYNQQPFKLHGQMDLRITFWEKTMVTPVYIMRMPMTSCCCQRESVDS